MNHKINNYINMTLKKLELTVQNFTSTLPGAIFTYINSYEIDSEDLSNQGNWPRFFFWSMVKERNCC
jgi:hypothetical protein